MLVTFDNGCKFGTRRAFCVWMHRIVIVKDLRNMWASQAFCTWCNFLWSRPTQIVREKGKRELRMSPGPVRPVSLDVSHNCRIPLPGTGADCTTSLFSLLLPSQKWDSPPTQPLHTRTSKQTSTLMGQHICLQKKWLSETDDESSLSSQVRFHSGLTDCVYFHLQCPRWIGCVTATRATARTMATRRWRTARVRCSRAASASRPSRWSTSTTRSTRSGSTAVWGRTRTL